MFFLFVVNWTILLQMYVINIRCAKPAGALLLVFSIKEAVLQVRGTASGKMLVFRLNGTADKNQRQQSQNSVKFRESSHNHGTGRNVVSCAGCGDTVSTNLSLAQG